jgi:hypothetical protein
MKTNAMTQVPIGAKVRLKKPWFNHTDGVVVAAERIIKNKPHRIIHTVLFNGLEDQYDFAKQPVTGCFKATQFTVVE